MRYRLRKLGPIGRGGTDQAVGSRLGVEVGPVLLGECGGGGCEHEVLLFRGSSSVRSGAGRDIRAGHGANTERPRNWDGTGSPGRDNGSVEPGRTLEPDGVSRRERDVLALVGEHLTNAEIAQQLHLSVRTVESHVSSLLRKLAVDDRRALAIVAAEQAAAGTRTGRFVGAPVVTTTFVGRMREREEVLRALSESRLVTLVGPGGVGKTRLALAVVGDAASAVTGGATFVDLVPVRGSFLPQAVAAALGVLEKSGQRLEDTLFEQLQGRPSLIVFDNCEHVLDVVAPFVDRLLAACADVTVLATSRERLGVPAERIMFVPPLSLDRDGDAATGDSDAATLFVERAPRGRCGVRVRRAGRRRAVRAARRDAPRDRARGRAQRVARRVGPARRTRRSPSALDGWASGLGTPPFVAGGDRVESRPTR